MVIGQYMNGTNDMTRLVVEYKNDAPMELLDLAQSMICMGNQYKEYVVERRQMLPDDVKLYIREVRKGSTIIELIPMIAGALPSVVEHAGTVSEYAKHLKSIYEWYSGTGKEKPQHITKSALSDTIKIIEPIAKDRASQFNIGTYQHNGDIHVHVHLDSAMANASQNAMRRDLDEMKEPITGIHEQVVMYWAQARNQPDTKAGDKAKIESIYRGSVRVIFATDDIKVKMLYEEPHPFNKGYIVDVAVESIEDKPVLYKVLTFHDVVDL